MMVWQESLGFKLLISFESIFILRGKNDDKNFNVARC